MDLKELLTEVASGAVSPDEAQERLKTLPYEELGYATIDNHRELRTGFPEVVFCQSKRPDQAAEIFKTIYENSGLVLGTRADIKHFEAVHAVVPEAVFHEQARCITIGEPEEQRGNVAICTAGTTDIPVAEEAALTAVMCGAKVYRYYDIGVSGIHRLLGRIESIREANAVVAVAGMEGALASVVSGMVERPVIAVPTSIGYGANFGGLSALLSMLNSCAAGTSVVNIDNGFGAGYMAAQINRLAVE